MKKLNYLFAFALVLSTFAGCTAKTETSDVTQSETVQTTESVTVTKETEDTSVEETVEVADTSETVEVADTSETVATSSTEGTEACAWENINYDTTYYVAVDDTEQHVYTESYHLSDDNLETEFSSKVNNDTILQYFKDNSGMFAELCTYDGPSGCYVAVTEHDLDKDGTNEMLINVNYGVTGTVGYPGDFAIVDDNAVVYWSKSDMNTTINRQNMGMYFTEDPFSTCGFNDVCAYPSIAKYDFSVNADNCFIGCEISNNSVLNSYYQVISEDGVYSVNCIKTVGWMQKSDEDANYWRELYSVEE